MRAAAILGAALVAAGCKVGLSAHGFHPARSPAGVLVAIQTSASTLRGELLGMTPDGVVVLDEARRVTSVPYPLVRHVWSKQMRSVIIRSNERNVPGRLAYLRRVSRFPQGVSEDLIRDLLAAYGQDSLVVVGR